MSLLQVGTSNKTKQKTADNSPSQREKPPEHDKLQKRGPTAQGDMELKAKQEYTSEITSQLSMTLYVYTRKGVAGPMEGEVAPPF